jgi:hypothetical protein
MPDTPWTEQGAPMGSRSGQYPFRFDTFGNDIGVAHSVLQGHHTAVGTDKI